MFCTGHTDLVLEVGNSRVVFQSLPLAAGVDHAGVGSLLNNAIGIRGVIIVIPCLNKQCVGSRPGEAERDNDPVLLIIPAVL